jgi:hypothetical protein
LPVDDVEPCLPNLLNPMVCLAQPSCFAADAALDQFDACGVRRCALGIPENLI